MKNWQYYSGAVFITRHTLNISVTFGGHISLSVGRSGSFFWLTVPFIGLTLTVR